VFVGSDGGIKETDRGCGPGCGIGSGSERKKETWAILEASNKWETRGEFSRPEWFQIREAWETTYVKGTQVKKYRSGWWC